MIIYTIGHSTYTKEEFIEMLKYADIDFLVDVRAFPKSKKHPQFDGDEMKAYLKKENIQYEQLEQLGGRRGQSGCVGETLNDGWKNQSFHNYADYTLEDDFKEGIKELEAIAKKHHVAIMCSERHPARCHRLIISNYLLAHHIEVIHILRNGNKIECVPHHLGEWGAMPILEDDGEVVYPELKEE